MSFRIGGKTSIKKFQQDLENKPEGNKKKEIDLDGLLLSFYQFSKRSPVLSPSLSNNFVEEVIFDTFDELISEIKTPDFQIPEDYVQKEEEDSLPDLNSELGEQHLFPETESQFMEIENEESSDFNTNQSECFSLFDKDEFIYKVDLYNFSYYLQLKLKILLPSFKVDRRLKQNPYILFKIESETSLLMYKKIWIDVDNDNYNFDLDPIICKYISNKNNLILNFKPIGVDISLYENFGVILE